MKRFSIFFTLFFSFFLISSMQAQETPAFGKVSYLSAALNDNWASGAGGMGAKFLNKTIYLGGGGYALSNAEGLSMGYGGVILGYQWSGKEDRNSVNFQVLGGYGAAAFEDEGGSISDDYYVLQPSVEVEFPITNWMRAGVGGGFRMTRGVSLGEFADPQLSGTFASLSLRFGSW